MKKFFVILASVMLTVASLYANEDAVKQTVIREYQLHSEGKMIETLLFYVSDYAGLSAKKTKITYKDIQTIAKMLSGKDLEAFVRFIMKAKSQKDPTPEEEKQIKILAASEHMKTLYPLICEKMLDAVKRNAKISLDSLKFIKVTVNGNQAEAVYEYNELDSADIFLKGTVKRTSTAKFRKENGVWKFVEVIQK